MRTLNEYFPKEQAMGYKMGTEVKTTIQTIANRFIADNPPVPVMYYLRSKKQFSISEDYMDEIKLHEKFPNMKPETYVYAWAQFTPPQAGAFHFRFSAYGPVKLFVNGILAYRTSHVQERFSEEVSDICLELQEGANSLLFECISTPLGCGFHIGSSSYKGRRIQFFGPDEAHSGMSGFIYSEPVLSKVEVDHDEQLKWYPEMKWRRNEMEQSPIQRIFGKETVGYFLSITKFECASSGYYTIAGELSEDTVLYIEKQQFELSKGSYSKKVYLKGGSHVMSFYGGTVTAVLTDEYDNEIVAECPVQLAEKHGLSWIYAGPFRQCPDIEKLMDFRKPIETAEGVDFWRVDMPDMWIRPFNEGTLYGEWNYPLGVTLYGMIQSARLLENKAIESYVAGHMRKCTSFYKYCMWDKSVYGAAPFHNQLTTVDSLDDCGSFASALLEVMKTHEIEEGDRISDFVADYIRHKQKRLEDGTFYRNDSYLPIMNHTMWADDLYMSIPFLCRYYERSQKEEYLNDAIHQVENFYRYLYMPDLGIMSHIYDTLYNLQTKVPWGRGNGWVLFSITELLAVMPLEHEKREEMLAIYRKLCNGYLALQGEEGMWHQVLTMPSSYEETSCTAMFIYGFARGIRYGWLVEPQPFKEAVEKGWKALCHKAIDWKGNIYGVCRGSGYSFSKEYYANDLSWNINDTHGTGIVMLAGIEVEKMRQEEVDIDENRI